MTITTLNKKAIAVTGLPDDARDFFIAMHNMLAFSTETPGKLKMKGDYIQLPEGNWTILGRADELTEEDWKRVVEKMPWGEECYKNYELEDNKRQYVGKYPTESGHSLLKAKGLHVENPIVRPTFPDYNKKVHTCENDIVDIRYDEHQWQSAELLTNPLVLIQ